MESLIKTIHYPTLTKNSVECMEIIDLLRTKFLFLVTKPSVWGKIEPLGNAERSKIAPRALGKRNAISILEYPELFRAILYKYALFHL